MASHPFPPTACDGFTESQNSWGWRELWRSPSPAPAKAGRVQAALGCLQRGQLSLGACSRAVPLPRNEILLHVEVELAVFSLRACEAEQSPARAVWVSVWGEAAAGPVGRPSHPVPSLQKHSSEWKPEIRLPSGSDHVMLKALDWNADYEVYVIAENQQGKSKPAHYAFRTSAQPTVIPGTAAPPLPRTPLPINATEPPLMCPSNPDSSLA